MSIETGSPVGANEASKTEMGKKLQESEIQVKSPDSDVSDSPALENEFVVEQLELDRKLDQIQPFVNILDRPRDADDKDEVFAKIEADAKSLLSEWKKVHDRLPEKLKQSTDGRDLALKIQIIEKCLEETAQIEQVQTQIQQM